MMDPDQTVRLTPEDLTMLIREAHKVGFQKAIKALKSDEAKHPEPTEYSGKIAAFASSWAEWLEERHEDLLK